MPTPITQERAERIARSHACIRCREYSYKKLTVRPATDALQRELNEHWHAWLVCGICGTYQELGIDDEGEVLYTA